MRSIFDPSPCSASQKKKASVRKLDPQELTKHAQNILLDSQPPSLRFSSVSSSSSSSAGVNVEVGGVGEVKSNVKKRKHTTVNYSSRLESLAKSGTWVSDMIDIPKENSRSQPTQRIC